MGFVYEIKNLIFNFPWTQPSWSLLILGGWILVSAVYGVTSARGRVISALIAVYIAKLFVLEAPFLAEKVGGRLPAVMQASQTLFIFSVLFVILFIFLNRYAFRTGVDGKGIISIPFVILFSFIIIGCLISVVLGMLPEVTQQSFEPLVRSMFIGQTARFIWLVLPIMYLIIAGRFIASREEA